jgi:hypothetical protein
MVKRSQLGELHPKLEVSAADRTAKALKVVASGVPIIGGPLAEILTDFIPQQRLDRVCELLSLLHERQIEFGNDFAEFRARYSPEKIALIEDGIRYAGRALTSERIVRIVDIVAKGLTDAAVDVEDERNFLELLDRVSDADIILLLSYTDKRGKDADWMRANDRIVSRNQLTKIYAASVEAENKAWDEDALRQLRLRRVVSLGLLVEQSGFDGGIIQLSRVGRMFLRRLDLLKSDET